MPYEDIDIVETGLRPGEKLYEELLMKSDGLIKTTSSKIFIERQQEISQQEMDQKLEILRQALQRGDRESIRRAMKRAVPRPSVTPRRSTARPASRTAWSSGCRKAKKGLTA